MTESNTPGVGPVIASVAEAYCSPAAPMMLEYLELASFRNFSYSGVDVAPSAVRAESSCDDAAATAAEYFSSATERSDSCALGAVP